LTPHIQDVGCASFHAAKCCHLVSEHKAYAECLCNSACQFLIYSTFVLVVAFAGIM